MKKMTTILEKDTVGDLEIQKFMHKAISIAKSSQCRSSKCGAVITNNIFPGEQHQIVGVGWSRPPKNAQFNCDKCYKFTENQPHPKSDKHCCLHAEQLAMFDAIRTHGVTILQGARIYFARLDMADHFIPSGDPYCTICSKMALELGIKEWVLGFLKEGKIIYTIFEANYYNTISFKYQEAIKNIDCNQQ